MAWKSAPRTLPSEQQNPSDLVLGTRLWWRTQNRSHVSWTGSPADQITSYQTRWPWRLRQEDLKLEVSLAYVRLLSQNNIKVSALGCWRSGSVVENFLSK